MENKIHIAETSGSSSDIQQTEDEKKITTDYYSEIDEDKYNRIVKLLGKPKNSDETDAAQDIHYVLDKIDGLSLEDALEILRTVEKNHKNDLNFPKTSKKKIEQLLHQPELFSKDEYDFGAKAEAAVIYYFSLYPEVRAVTAPQDDPEEPCETIRAYILGLAWAVIGQFINSFFNSRYPNVTINSVVCQTLLYPCGKLFQLIIPDWGFNFRGIHYSLNSGPWSYKEQMFATIIFNVSMTSVYVFYNIQTQEVYYDDDWLDSGYKILLILSTQSMGLGFAGLLRRFVVFPVEAIWPTVLPTMALNRALLIPENKETVHGWKISKYPIGGLIILAIYYTNTKWSAYFPINSSSLYDNTGESYNVTKVIKNGRLDQQMYENYSPPFFSAANLLSYSAFFMTYPLLFIYVLVDQWQIVVRAYGDIWKLIKGTSARAKKGCGMAFHSLARGNFKGFFTGIGHIFSEGKSVYDGFDDPFTRSIKKYPEVPNWWFMIVVLVSFIFAIILLTAYPLGTPVWTIFFVIGINIIFLVPMTLMSATTGITVGLNVLVELVIGYALPGNAEALMFVKAYGYNIDSQASTYTSDQKMSHYSRIPPRTVFRGQIVSTIITSFVSYGVVNFVDTSISGICTTTQAQKFTCANGSRVFFSASVMWGLIGPKRVFGEQYPALKWMFLVGFIVAVVWCGLKKYGATIREWIRESIPHAIFSALDSTIFKVISLLRNVHPALITIGVMEWAPLNMAFQTMGLYLSAYFMYYLKRHKTSWWEKYNYVLSAGLSAGVAFSAIIIFFAVQYHSKNVSWWGNNITAEGVDGYAGQTALYTDLPDKGYIGPDYWS
ncbi:hypothetical protein FOA43_001781 [Brettanomyces nanus]|uniref:Oligopeptide transporter 2 n=1 Tax=Eeniella nana TaxID=13502 RepID=A0A875RY79_EENNA|nr:uncharacterized protein FOA43_001781 [Brettanomyces nanus]QPG74451.1 hypothetical protein FOA43_001781 [Brettanomyces nanus]